MQDLFLSLNAEADQNISGSSEREDRDLFLEAAFQVALATSRILELRAVAVAFKYPEALVRIGTPHSKQTVLADDLVRAAGDSLLKRLVAPQLAGVQEDDPLETFIRFRKLAAVRQLLEELGSEVIARFRGIDELAEKCRKQIRELPERDRSPVRECLKDYLLNQWLYPGTVTDTGRQLGSVYDVLFDEAHIPRGEIGVLETDVLKRALANASLDADLGELVQRVVGAIERAVSEYGLESLADIISEGGSPLSNLPPEVGVIPGDARGPCPRILVGIATNKKASHKFGAVSVMGSVRDAMIECCDAGVKPYTEIVIFVGHLEAIPRLIEENMRGLDGHLRKGVLKAFIPIGVLRNRTNVLSWR